jgi:hypothetical protein
MAATSERHWAYVEFFTAFIARHFLYSPQRMQKSALIGSPNAAWKETCGGQSGMTFVARAN